MAIRIKNWKRFQHFKDRRPPWIKLYRELLDDPEWHDLDPQSSKVLVMLWLIASENDGELPSVKKLAFRLRMFEKQLLQTLTKLSHWLIQDDIAPISDGYHDDTPEQETETETETYKEETEGEKEKEEPLSGKPDGAPPYIEIISYLNVKTGKAFRASGKGNQSHIHARWKEGFTLDQFLSVIDKKCTQWKGDPKMDAFLRPQTLFAGNFESYLNEKEVKGNGSSAGIHKTNNSLNKERYNQEASNGVFGKCGEERAGGAGKTGKYDGIGTAVITGGTGKSGEGSGGKKEVAGGTGLEK